MSISGSSVTVQQDTTVDPRFPVPPAINVIYTTREDIATDESDGLDEQVPVSVTIEDPYGSGTSGTTVLYPPNYITVVSQTVRVVSGGTQVVDVLLEVEDVQGAASFEVKVAKA